MTPSFSVPRRLLIGLGLALACFLVYFPGLSGGFLFDDFPNIVTNARLQVTSWDAAAFWQAAHAYTPGMYGRPLATLGFALDFSLGGKDAGVFKIHSLLVHCLTTLLVFGLVRRLLALPHAGGAWPAWAAPAMAAVWALHPLQVSTVLYVVQRMEMLATLFVVLALLAYLKGRLAQRDGRPGGAWLALAALCVAVGMLSKESAILMPLFALALEATLLRFEAAHASTRRFLVAAYAGGVVLGMAGFIFYLLPGQLAPEAYAYRDFSLAERLLTQLRVLPMYLGQILLPLPDGMPFYYDNYPKSTGWFSPPSTIAGGVLLLALLGAAVWLRHRTPLVSLGIFWFFASHLLTSNVIPLELVFEHRNYFALLGVVIAMAGLARLVPASVGTSVPAICTVLLIAGLAGLCAVRAATWGNPLLLATDLVARNPGSPRASNDLATLYIAYSGSDPGSPFFSFGQREFERGAALPNSSPLAEQGLILMAATTGQQVDDAWWDSLIAKLGSRPIGPQESMAVVGLMNQHYDGIELDKHRLSEAYATLLARGGGSVQMYLQYADFLLVHMEDRQEATRYYVEAMDASGMTPDYALRIMAAMVADGKGDIVEAMQAHANAR